MENAAPELPRLLIVDDSRMVRASIIKHLKGRYAYREEVNGEAAWQTLVLDPTIRAVISDLGMPVLDGFGLLERVRQSKLARVRQLPVIMISGDEDEESRQRAKALGATDFITKGIGTVELLARLESLVRLGRVQDALAQSRAAQVKNPDTGLFTRAYLTEQLAQALSLARRHGQSLSLVALSFDHYEALCQAQGPAWVKLLEGRFLEILGGNIRKEDSLGHYAPGAYLILCPETSLGSSEAFCERLRRAVATAQVSAQGQRLHLSVSIGIANSLQTPEAEAEAFLGQAVWRMESALVAGGDRVVSHSGGASAAPACPSLEQALAWLAAGEGEQLRPHLGALESRVFPILKFLNTELQWGFPVTDLERRLEDKAEGRH